VDLCNAVVTTGIYCRSACGVQVKSGNVRTYLLPAAAEAAGYRACLRCRPYRLPQLPSWVGGPELVCRAVGLIVEGWLNHTTEAELGARLGVSARHLRRLFVQHLGGTPVTLARSARTHFARRLLDETDLTMVEIAYASGFGSVRQLHRACREIFRMSPSELRARRRVSDRLVADGGLLLRLPFSGPLDWDAMLAYFSARGIPGVEHVSDAIYRRTIVLQGKPGVLELFPGDERHLILRAHLPHWRELMHIVERARRLAGLDVDISDATEHLGSDPAVGALVRARPGVRVPGAWDPFEIGVRAIIGQGGTLAASNAAARQLVERFGTPVGGLHQLGLTHTFPAAEVLAEADLELGLSSDQTDAVRRFAQAVRDDEIALDRSIPLERLVGSLTAIGGIGRWAAHYIALRIGERDAFPFSDFGLQSALPNREHLGKQELDTMVEQWRPWRALAATHFWLARQEQGQPDLREDAA
jgi:AraC family transcriptional regulator, regulatory protein of adaptative response / DNA-3-methyladenine glycosylase II